MSGQNTTVPSAHPTTPSSPIPIKPSKTNNNGRATPTKGLVRTGSLHQAWLSSEKEEKRKHVGAPKKEDEEDFALSAPFQKKAVSLDGINVGPCGKKKNREHDRKPAAEKGKVSVSDEKKEELVETPREKLGPDQFELLAVIGIGAYGRVFQVKEKESGRIYAMKVLQKGQILKKNNLRYVHEEKDILTRVNCPFVVSLMCAFQTTTKLYLVMEYLCGGELFHHLRNEGLFMEDTACFYTAEIVCALEYLHSCKIIHRDLKPENVLLDANGHVRLTDFGLATVESGDNQAKTICGTDLYMAPEMLGGNGYGRAVDWWSLGTLLFEMLTGDPPFFARDTKQLYKKIMREKPKYPRWLSSPCHSLLKGLLTRNVDQRLGAAKSTMFKTRGVQEVKSHRFFNDIDWNVLEKLEMPAPFRPKSNEDGNVDVSNFDEKITKMVPRFSDELAPKYRSHLQRADEDAFSGFSYVRDSFLEESMKGLPIQTVDTVDVVEGDGEEPKDDRNTSEIKRVPNGVEIPVQAKTPEHDTKVQECNACNQPVSDVEDKDEDRVPEPTLPGGGQPIDDSADHSIHPSPVVWPLPQTQTRTDPPEETNQRTVGTIPKTLMRKGSSYASAVSNGEESSNCDVSSRLNGDRAIRPGLNVNAKPWTPPWEQ